MRLGLFDVTHKLLLPEEHCRLSLSFFQEQRLLLGNEGHCRLECSLLVERAALELKQLTSFGKDPSLQLFLFVANLPLLGLELPSVLEQSSPELLGL